MDTVSGSSLRPFADPPLGELHRYAMPEQRNQGEHLITQGPMDLYKAILPPGPGAHPRAVLTLLEGLSLFLNERLKGRQPGMRR
jgi:hypothetical protein